ncbi:MAG: flagellar basal body P-ring formation protein FlgA [Planctomycetaceae bacterium]|nr:flagellar basal body P-ring formation protein FlgA [Planctomycetaceae bacterium]
MEAHLRSQRDILPRTIGLLAVAICCAATSLQANGAEIVLKPTAVVEGELIQLKHIADIRDPDPEIVEHLGAVVISPAPAAGRDHQIGYDAVRTRLLALGFNLGSLEFTGSHSVVVGRGSAPRQTAVPAPKPSESPSPAAIEERLRSLIEAHYLPLRTDQPSLRVKVQVHSSDLPRLSAVPNDRLKFAEMGLRLGGPQPVTVHWNDAAGQPQSTRVAVWLTSAPRVLAIRGSLPRGSIIQAADLQWNESESERGLKTLEAAIGRETTRNLRDGEILQLEDLRAVPLVRTGDIVTVRIRTGALLASRQFKSLGTAGLDETVTLAALDNPRDRVQAVVTGYHEAAMSLAGTIAGNTVQDATGVIRFEQSSNGGGR